MNYKQKLLIEYRDLLAKINNLLHYLNLNKGINEQEDKLLTQQLDIMNGYLNVLEERLLIILEKEKEPY